MKAITLAIVAIPLATLVGCRSSTTSFVGHKINESYEEFAAIEKPSTEMPPGISFTGVIHCFDTKSLGDHCSGHHTFDKSPIEMDNAHFTFVDGHLRRVECVGAGGIIDDPRQNWNWNLYLSELKKQYGPPTKMNAEDAVWVRGDSVVHAFLTVDPMMFSPSKKVQTEHMELQSKSDYEEQKSKT